jgi:uncharacterized protein YhfF
VLASISPLYRARSQQFAVGSFGDGPKMATELADLVMDGIKKATTSGENLTLHTRSGGPLGVDIGNSHQICERAK